MPGMIGWMILFLLAHGLQAQQGKPAPASPAKGVPSTAPAPVPQPPAAPAPQPPAVPPAAAPAGAPAAAPAATTPAAGGGGSKVPVATGLIKSFADAAAGAGPGGQEDFVIKKPGELTFTTGVVIEGRVEKPQVMLVLSKEALRLEPVTFEKSFLENITRPLQYNAFEFLGEEKKETAARQEQKQPEQKQPEQGKKK